MVCHTIKGTLKLACFWFPFNANVQHGFHQKTRCVQRLAIKKKKPPQQNKTMLYFERCPPKARNFFSPVTVASGCPGPAATGEQASVPGHCGWREPVVAVVAARPSHWLRVWEPQARAVATRPLAGAGCRACPLALSWLHGLARLRSHLGHTLSHFCLLSRRPVTGSVTSVCRGARMSPKT